MALDLSGDSAQEIASQTCVLGSLEGLRLVPAEQYHITLSFFLSLSDQQLQLVAHSVRHWQEHNLSALPITAQSEPRLLPRPAKAHSLVLEATGSGAEAITTIWQSFNTHLRESEEAAGMAPLNSEFGLGGRPFRPHLTLARGKKPEALKQGLEFLVGKQQPWPWTLAGVGLYRSTLTHKGPVYGRV